MDLGLKDKRVVVTGGSAGIGFAAAEIFLEEGAYVTIAARREEKLNEAVKKLSKIAGPDRIQGVVTDCSREKDIKALAQKAAGPDGSIDIWINNVGTNVIRKGELYSEEEMDYLIGTNFKSALFGCQTAYTYMKNKGGSIINVGSLAARCASCGRATLYGALKSGMVGLTRTTAGEYAAYGIRVNAVLPGFTATELVQKAQENGTLTEMDRIIDHALIPRMAKPREVANAIVFLSSSAASFITAETLEVSGGTSTVLNPWYSFEKRAKEQ